MVAPGKWYLKGVDTLVGALLGVSKGVRRNCEAKRQRESSGIYLKIFVRQVSMQDVSWKTWCASIEVIITNCTDATCVRKS